MEPLKRGLSLFNFCYILYILLRAHHGCLNSRYFRNSHRDWNSTFYARVHCLQGLSFITKIHLKICVELRSWTVRIFLDCVGRFDYTPTRSLLFGDSWVTPPEWMQWSFRRKTEIYLSFTQFAADSVQQSSEHNGFFTLVSATYTYISYMYKSQCVQSLSPTPSSSQADTNTTYRYCHTCAHREAMIDTLKDQSQTANLELQQQYL